MSSAWRRRVRELFPQARFDEPMSRHTTFRIGGPADCWVEPRNTGELARLIGLARSERLPVLFLGWGSNLLVQDGGVRGVVARLRGDFERMDFPGEGLVSAGAGVRVPKLVSRCSAQGLAGTEPLVGVPGTVGGALVMNAGTREGEIGPLVREVSVLDEETLEPSPLPRSAIRFEYRASNLEGRILLGCLLELKAGDKGDIMKRVKKFSQKRLQTQPIHTYNVGSTFKNPPGRFVAKLIEEAGLKGLAVGGARVSPLHANFVENFAKATAAEVLELVRRVRRRIRASAGIELELEMKVVGEP